MIGTKTYGSKLALYLSIDTLEDLAVFDDVYPNLNAIAKYHSIIYVNINEENLQTILSDTERDISQFCNRNQIRIEAADYIFNRIKSDYKILANNPRSMFFLDVTREEAKSLSDKYGVIVQSETSINDAILQLSYRRHLEKNEQFISDKTGWVTTQVSWI